MVYNIFNYFIIIFKYFLRESYQQNNTFLFDRFVLCVSKLSKAQNVHGNKKLLEPRNHEFQIPLNNCILSRRS